MPIATFFLAPYRSLLQNRSLVWRMTKREIAARVQATMLGPVWLVLSPLISLVVYQFIFVVVFDARWPTPSDSHVSPALVLLTGLTVFSIFSENVSRAPGLVLEQITYVKKVVFPLECLPWISLLGSLVNVAISVVLLLLLQTALDGPPPITAFFLPLILLPFMLVVLGLCWFFAAVGVYLRDTKQIVSYFIPLTMFLCPLFYPIERSPESLRPYLYLNPATLIIQEARNSMLWGVAPEPVGYLIACGAGLVLAAVGHWGFMRARRGFADVL